ncbi:hypothetical protein H9Y04_40470 [Streptomyces sp. TRM66268-LWL]|uniref:Uncharacterized protein n=1 Tax=Streptomyces polyasparticus TaxID=2767826 RepID=A0ABR7STK2_9ACTN|nr:hypothetical protein [Streptomyces polyasparticus]MBC9718821.1 hypothetical protein [Streptomyces polyasparticus]
MTHDDRKNKNDKKRAPASEAAAHRRPDVPRGDSAVDQALTELEEAETGGRRRKWGREGEAGDTLTPNRKAQEEAQDDS